MSDQAFAFQKEHDLTAGHCHRITKYNQMQGVREIMKSDAESRAGEDPVWSWIDELIRSSCKAHGIEADSEFIARVRGRALLETGISITQAVTRKALLEKSLVAPYGWKGAEGYDF